MDWKKCRKKLRDAGITLDTKDEKRVEELIAEGFEPMTAIRQLYLERSKNIIDIMRRARQSGADVVPYTDTYDTIISRRQTMLARAAQKYMDERNVAGLYRETLKAENRAILQVSEFLKGLGYLIRPQLGIDQDIIRPNMVIRTEDGYRFDVLEDGSITDGDMTWPNSLAFADAMANNPTGPINWRVVEGQEEREVRGEVVNLANDDHLLALFEVMLFQDRSRKKAGREGVLEQWDLPGDTPEQVLAAFRDQQAQMVKNLREISHITIKLAETEERWRTLTDREWRNPNFSNIDSNGDYIIEPPKDDGVAEDVMDYIVRGFRGQHGKPDERLIQTRLPTIVFTPEPDTANLYAQQPNNRKDFAEAPRVVVADLEMKNPIRTDDIDPFFDLSDLVEAVGLDAVLELAEDTTFEDAVMGTDNFDEYRRNNFPLSMEEDGQTTYPREDFDELSLREILEQHPDSIDQLYGLAWVALQNEKFVQALKDAGYDSAVIGGSGENSGEVEYHVFDESQIRPPGVREDIIDYSVTYVSQFPWEVKSSGDGDLYISRIGPNAGTPHKERQSPNDLAITFNRNVLLPDYMYYVLMYLQPQIAARARGTAQQAIRKGDVHDVILEHFENQAREPVRTQGPAQGDLFSDENLNPDPATRRKEAEANYKALVGLVEEKDYGVGITHVRTAEEAAHVFAPIRKNAQEGFWALVLDKDNKILGLLEHAKGTIDGTSVYPSVMAGHIYQIPGAAKVWFGHNHPGMNPAPSQADERITKKITELMRGGDVSVEGHIIVAANRDRFVPLDADGNTVPGQAGSGTIERAIKPAARKHRVPIYSRRFKSKPQDGRKMTFADGPAIVEEIAQSVDEGIIFLNNRHHIVGVMAMSAEEMKTLRGTGRATKLLRAQSELGAAAMITFTRDKDTDASSNMAVYGSEADVRMLDNFYLSPSQGMGWQSLVGQGELTTGGRRTFNQDLVGITSGLLEAAKAMPQDKGPAEQMIAVLKKQPGVKKEEVDWIQLEDWIRAKGYVTRDEIIDFVDKNGIVVEEHILSERATSFNEWEIAFDFQSPDSLDADWAADEHGIDPADLESGDTQVFHSSIDQLDLYFTVIFDRQWGNVIVVDDDTKENIPIFDPINGQDLSSARNAIRSYGIQKLNEREGGPIAGTPQFTQYTLPGGFNHREVVFRLPHPYPGRPVKATASGHIVAPEGQEDVLDEIITMLHSPEWELQGYLEDDAYDWGRVGDQIIDFDKVPLQFWQKVMEIAESPYFMNRGVQVEEFGRTEGDIRPDYTDHHAFTQWTNVLMWMRLSEHYDTDGNLVLVIEEIQSDWHQQGRRHGYQDQTSRDEVRAAARTAERAKEISDRAEQAIDNAIDEIMWKIWPQVDWLGDALDLPVSETDEKQILDSRRATVKRIIEENADWLDVLDRRAAQSELAELSDKIAVVYRGREDPSAELAPGLMAFSSSESFANRFGGRPEKHTLKRPENPYIIEANEEGWHHEILGEPEFINELKAEGHDGVIIRGLDPSNGVDTVTNYIVFEPQTQVDQDGFDELVNERALQRALRDMGGLLTTTKPVSLLLSKEDISDINDYRVMHHNWLDAETRARDARHEADARPIDAPFKNNAWAELAMKRAIRFAAEEGYAKLVWTTGDQQNARYPELVDYYETITYNPHTQRLSGIPLVGRVIDRFVEPHRLEAYVGPRIAQMLMDRSEEMNRRYEVTTAREADVTNYDVRNHLAWVDEHLEIYGGDPADGYVLVDENGELVRDPYDPLSILYYTDRDAAEASKWSYIEDQDTLPTVEADEFSEATDGIEVGGQGMRGFYDKVLPNLASRAIKKLDKKAKVDRFGHRIRTLEYEDHGISLTSSLEVRALYGGPNSPENFGVWQLDQDGAPGYMIEGGFGTYAEAAEKMREIEEGATVHGIEITTDLSARAMLGQTLFQDRQRGSITFDERNKATVRLTRARDMSTFLHEGGHLFLELMGDIAEMDGASEQSVADYQKILKFLGVEHRSQIKRVHHEKFARAFEAYLREGKAPDPGLRDIFLAFKSWLMRVYKQLRQLDVELNDDIRGVFDRMIATDVAIQQARQVQNYVELFTSAEDMGISQEAFEVYRRNAVEAHEDALEREHRRVLDDMMKEEQAWWQDERKKTEEEVRQEAHGMRVYRALAMLQRGQNPDGTTPETATFKLSKDSLMKLLKGSKETMKRLPGRGKTLVYTVKGGVDAAIAAKEFGYPDATTMITEIIRAKPMEDFIQAETDARMAERFPDPLVSGEIQEQALDAVHNNRQAQVMAAEMRALRKRIKADRAILGAERRADRRRQREAKEKMPKRGEIALIKEAAKEVISRMKIRDIKPHTYLAAERKAGRKAFQAMEKKDYEAAYKYKRQQLVNHEMYRAAQRAQDATDKGRRYMTRFERKPTRQRMGKAGVLDRIDAILENISLRKISLAEVDRRNARSSLILAIRNGQIVAPPEVVDRLEDDGVNYQDLTVTEFLGMRDIIRQLEKIGKHHYEMIVNGEKQNIQDTVDELVNTLHEVGEAIQTGVGQPRRKEKRQTTVKAAVSAILRPGAIARVLDGSGFGAFTQKIIVPIRRAYAERMLPAFQKASEDVVKIYTDNYDDAELKRMNSETFYIETLGESLTKGEMLSIALNWGSETNRKALLGGKKNNGDQAYPQQAVRQILGMLDSRDWKFVQEVWDYLETYWDDVKDDQGNVVRPGLKSTEQRRRGIAPEKVDAMPFTIKASDGQEVELRGGYYPLVYDRRHSKRQKIQEFEDVQQKMGNGVYVSSNTRAGATYNRVTNHGKVVRVGLNTIDLHLREILRDIAIGDEVNFVKRVLEHPDLDAAFEQTGNTEALKQLKMWLDDSAVGELPAAGFWEQSLAYIRTGFTKAKIGWNLVTMFLQLTGVFQTAAEMGTANYMKGVGKIMQSPRESWKFIMERSSFMKQRYDSGAWNKDVADARDHLQTHFDWLLGEGPTKARRVSNRMARTLFAPIMVMQSQVDASTWMAGYIKARNDGMSEQDAILFADARTEAAQTSGFFADRSGIERGSVNYKTVQSQFVRMWTTLISYMLAKWGIAYEKGATAKREIREGEFTFGSAVKFASDMLLLFTIEGIASAIIYGKLPDDDDDEPIAWWVAKVSMDSAISGVPFVRETAAARFGGGNTVVGSLTKDIYTVYQQAGQGEVDAALVKSLNNVGGTLFHYPSSQMNRMIDSAWAEAEGEDVAWWEYGLGRRKDD